MRISDWSSDVCSSDLACSSVVRSDAQLLRRIVQNRLSNALKYTDSGSILLGARRRGETLSIEIHDTGPGIAAEYHQAIFEEFRRVSPAGTRASGLGLGLAIRSEEHTSELQSLMRISYAVFCLKKKTKTDINNAMTTISS